MKIFPSLRLLVFARRIARALEEQNRLLRDRLRFEFPDYARMERKQERKTPRPAEISVASVGDWNEAYHAKQRERGLED